MRCYWYRCKEVEGSMGVWQGVAMGSLKFYPGLPRPTLLCPEGGPPPKRPYGRFMGGPPAALFYSFGHRTPYAYGGFCLFSQKHAWRNAVGNEKRRNGDVKDETRGWSGNGNDQIWVSLKIWMTIHIFVMMEKGHSSKMNAFSNYAPCWCDHTKAPWTRNR